MVKATDIYNYLNEIMPFETQESWDNSGLLVNSDVGSEKVLCCLDVTRTAVDKAVSENCNIIVSHHPVIFSGIKALDSDSLLFKLIQNNISVISAHTNFDKYEFGTGSKLADFCGLKGDKNQAEFAVVVNLEKEMSFADFLSSVKENTKIPLQYVSGTKTVKKVMVIAGSGKGESGLVMAENCDCLITGESGYHDMLDLKEEGIGTIVLGHDESEKISVSTLAELIKDEFNVETVEFTEESLIKSI